MNRITRVSHVHNGDSARAGELRWTRDPALGDVRKRYLDRIDGLVIGDRPETGVFIGNLFVHPGLDFEMSFPKGWMLKHHADAQAHQAGVG